jgi:3',5'-cyclic AMP phosphodiesterase CpdA
MRTIAQISDLHFGRHDSTVAEDLLASLARACPDLVAVSGDFTQRARAAEFAQARRFLSRIPQPILVVPGNHDMPLYDLFGRFLSPFAKYNRYISPVGLPGCFFHDGEIAVLGLNTARRLTGKHGRVSLEQIAHVGRVFEAVPRERFKALVTHHPLGFPAGEPLRLAGRSLLALNALAAAGVHLLLSGHHHRAASGHLEPAFSCKGPVLILHAGTAISTRTRGVESNSYNVVRIAGCRVAIGIMEWAAGQGFRERRAAAYRLHGERWVPA